MKTSTPETRLPIPQWPLYGRVLAGLFGLVSLLLVGAAPLRGPKWGPDTWPIFLGPLLFAIVCLSVAFFRVDLVLDRSTQELVGCRGWGPFVRVKRSSLAGMERVELTTGRADSRRGGVVYRVWLRGSEEEHRLMGSRDERRAVAQAREVARYLGWPLNDLRADEPILMSAEELRRPILEQVRDERLSLKRPPGDEIEVHRMGAVTHIRFHGSKLLPVLGGLCGIVALGSLASWMFWLRPQSVEGARLSLFVVSLIPLAFVLFAVVPMLIQAARVGNLMSRLQVDRQGVRMFPHTLPTEEIRELVIVSKNGRPHLRMATEKTILRVGERLTERDLRYLRALLIQTMRGDNRDMPGSSQARLDRP